MTQAVTQVLNASPFIGRVETVFDPPWTTDCLSEDGRRKLKEYGITPPVGSAGTLPSRKPLTVRSCDATTPCAPRWAAR